ncbi:HAMP domain-containing sensor histidine kinase [Variovorax sp. YR216]|uniref:sensor histidine kinase n=1 Tax=Variovorax sp. YR216 TaxID=1882828 RepID=UPI0008944482|nr:HAMP domain-containing sensor histidine kinase [Variovorax sp. YR216]SEA39194.1 His Kinase A (phospho-acceptor) domain-containing protein [Variovorax sp. YR216]
MRPSLLLIVLCLVTSLPGVAAPSKNVLVIFSNNRVLPANIDADRGIREGIARVPARRVDIFEEFLDRPTFSGPAFDATVATYLRDKYATRPPEAIVAAGEPALEFLLGHRAELFPNVPVVHLAIEIAYLKSIPPLPADVIGVPIDYDFAGTIEQAMRWRPAARRLVVVTGSGIRDRKWEIKARDAVAGLDTRATVEFLSGLATDALEQRLRALGDGDVVFTPGYFVDGTGREFAPRDSAALIAKASAAPVYGPFSTFIGTGVVGGRMPTYLEMGRQAANAVNGVLDGTAPSDLHLPARIPSVMQIDWRQAQRWGMADNDVPPDAVVHFKEPTIWEKYRHQALLIFIVMLLQTALIAALLVERRLRRRTASARKTAELQAEKDRAALTHMTRVSMMGQLSAAIAHQLNQPLAAILGNAEAARKMLGRGNPDLAELKDICNDIVTEDRRAAEVIRRLGALFRRGEMQLAPIDLNELVSETLELTRPELVTRRVSAATELAPLPLVEGNRVQLQQVLLNLILNAADAMIDVDPARRTLTVRTVLDGANVSFQVIDRGVGIPPGDLQDIFGAFWSTKAGGTGIGLAICQSIVAAHRGTLAATNNPEGGATFRVTWPVRQQN